RNSRDAVRRGGRLFCSLSLAFLDGSFGFRRRCRGCSRRLTDIPAQNLFEVDLLGDRFAIVSVFGAFGTLGCRHLCNSAHGASKLSVLLVGGRLCTFDDRVSDL